MCLYFSSPRFTPLIGKTEAQECTVKGPEPSVKQNRTPTPTTPQRASVARMWRQNAFKEESEWVTLIHKLVRTVKTCWAKRAHDPDPAPPWPHISNGICLLWSRRTAGICTAPSSQTHQRCPDWAWSAWKRAAPACSASGTALSSWRSQKPAVQGTPQTSARRPASRSCSWGCRRPRCPAAAGTAAETSPCTPPSPSTSLRCTGRVRICKRTPEASAHSWGSSWSCIFRTASSQRRRKVRWEARRKVWKKWRVPFLSLVNGGWDGPGQTVCVDL